MSSLTKVESLIVLLEVVARIPGSSREAIQYPNSQVT